MKILINIIRIIETKPSSEVTPVIQVTLFTGPFFKISLGCLERNVLLFITLSMVGPYIDILFAANAFCKIKISLNYAKIFLFKSWSG